MIINFICFFSVSFCTYLVPFAEEGPDAHVDSPDSSSTKDETSPEAVVTSPGASSDNAEVVRAADEQKETKELTSPGGLRSVKDQFEGGNVSNVEVKKMMDDEVIRPTAIQNEQAAPEGINTSGISENEPVVRDDVIKAGTPSDDPMSVSGGTRSILDRFEKGEVVKEDSEEDQTTSSKKVDVSAEIEEAKRREQELERAQPTVSENEPMVRDDVVRAGDAPEDIKLVEGGLGSLKDRFEKGVVSNIEDTPKRDPIKIGSLEDSTTNDPNHGTIAESTPIVRDDVVHSTDQAEEPQVKAGTSRSIKSMFEKGPVSNLEEKPKEKVELPRSLEDDRPAESGISENTPIERDDVVKSTPVKDEPIKVGGLRNLKSMFEQGNVSNIEEKPRQVDHHVPSTLDSSAPSDGGISENTPEVREDLVRETSPRDDYKVTSGHSRSLKDRWEKGEVERPEANYKTVVMKEEAIIVESKPEPQREDVITSDQPMEPVQITAGSNKNLRDRFEKGKTKDFILNC